MRRQHLPRIFDGRTIDDEDDECIMFTDVTMSAYDTKKMHIYGALDWSWWAWNSVEL